MAIPDLSGLTPAERLQAIKELQDDLAADRLAAQNIEQTVRQQAASGVDAIIGLIGPPASEATKSDASVNGLLAHTRAEINENPAVFLQYTWRLLRAFFKINVAALRVAGQRFDSTATGN